MKPLSIRQIALTNFKNYADATFALGERFNLVYGLNGTGKTNLLDSIYYLCVGKSYFTAFDQKVVRNGLDFFRIEGKVQRGEGNHEIVMKVRPGASKDILLDGTPRGRISEHLGFIPVVISAPKDIDLVQGSSQARRKYVDHLLCQIDPEYLRSLVAYNYLLQMRNASLKQEFPDLRRMVETFDEKMAPFAQAIYEKRKWLVTILLPLLKANYKAISDDRESITLDYLSRLEEYPYDVLADMHWESDKNLQRTSAGIHKDDFQLGVKDLTAKEFASQGQIKSLIFSLHLSKYRILSEQCGYQPVLILDDIFDKLDENRLSRLMEILMQPDFGQILLSDTSKNRVVNFVPSAQLKTIAM